MAEKPSSIALIALGISIMSAGFSIYQWWNSQYEARITAAIEISKQHMQSRDEKTLQAIVAAIRGQSLSSKQFIRIGKHADELEYISLLANTDRLDKSYLSTALMCDVVITAIAVNNLKKLFPALSKSPEHQLSDFSKVAVCKIDTVLPGFLPPQSN